MLFYILSMVEAITAGMLLYDGLNEVATEGLSAASKSLSFSLFATILAIVFGMIAAAEKIRNE